MMTMTLTTKTEMMMMTTRGEKQSIRRMTPHSKEFKKHSLYLCITLGPH